MKFIVYGNPVPKARPRMTKTGHCWTPKTTVQFEYMVQQVYSGQPDRKKIVAPAAIAVEINFYFARPNTSKRSLPTVKPDLDNCAKSCLDGLNGYAWTDDSQVVSLLATKHYAEHRTKARTEITIVEVADANHHP